MQAAIRRLYTSQTETATDCLLMSEGSALPEARKLAQEEGLMQPTSADVLGHLILPFGIWPCLVSDWLAGSLSEQTQPTTCLACSNGHECYRLGKVIEDLKQGGLNMVDIRSIFRSFKAVWIFRIFQSNPCVHGWVPLAHHYLKPFLNCYEDLIFNFDDTVDFCEIQKLNSFYREVFASYNAVFVKTEESFLRGIHDECLWEKIFCSQNKWKKENTVPKKLGA